MFARGAESKGIVSVTLRAALRKHGAGDGRFYGELGITAVAFGVDGSGQHGPDEYADITTLAPYYRALKVTLGPQ